MTTLYVSIIGAVIVAALTAALELRTRAFSELAAVLAEAGREAWEAADIGQRLAVWWREIRNPERADRPIYGRGPLTVFNERQLVALSVADRVGKVTNGDLQERFAYHPETLRQDLAALVEWGYLEKQGQSRGTFYTPRRGGGPC
jgi:DNA-binding transcriptional ArsR family regulator